MTWGFIAIDDNGNLLASSESANYELSARYTNGVRSGNVTTYAISPVDAPVVFIEVPVGGRAALLYVNGGTVRVIGDGNYPIIVYRRISGADGFGVSAYDAAGNLTFKATENLLNVQAIGTMGIGGNFSGAGSAVSFPALASITEKSTSESWEYFDYWIYQELVTVYECNQEFQCNYDGGTGQFVCDWVTVCGYNTQWVDTIVWIYARVKTTAWAVKRAVAKRVASNTYQQEWEVHASGYYKEVIDWAASYTTVNPAFITLPPGYTPGIIGYDPDSEFTGASGYFTMNNTFPYSNGQTASISATIMTR